MRKRPLRSLLVAVKSSRPDTHSPPTERVRFGGLFLYIIVFDISNFVMYCIADVISNTHI